MMTWFYARSVGGGAVHIRDGETGRALCGMMVATVPLARNEIDLDALGLMDRRCSTCLDRAAEMLNGRAIPTS